MPFGKMLHKKSGQAMAELVIALVTLVIIIVGTTAFAQIALSRIYLRRDIRASAGQAAITRSTAGWVEPEKELETSTSTAHKINDFNRLDSFHPELVSRLPASNYTLHSRNYAIGELGLRTTEQQKTVPLDRSFVSLIYSTSSQAGANEDGINLHLREKIVYPATDDLWPNSND